MTEADYIKIIQKKNEQINKYKKKIINLKKQNDYYKTMAFTDSLTKLRNRRSLNKIDSYHSVILGDIDHFKKINDENGHNFGDLVLIEVSNILKNSIRESDLVCRWGGEEFVILLKNCSNEDAYNKAIQLKERISQLEEKIGIRVTMSFGVSDISNKSLKTAIEEADKAMYISKEAGRNRVTVYSLNYN